MNKLHNVKKKINTGKSRYLEIRHVKYSGNVELRGRSQHYLLHKWFFKTYLEHGLEYFSESNNHFEPSTTFTWFMSNLDQFSGLLNKSIPKTIPFHWVN